ncbi:MAG: GNAT family N-acetyltransferase [Solirubrobacteraceae bacterium]
MNSTPTIAKHAKAGLHVASYSSSDRAAWDEFIAQARNSHFFFRRGYLEYHSDRFTDASLIVRERGGIVAVMPASVDNGVVTSHAGLTFGGVLSRRRLSAAAILRVVRAIVEYLGERGVTRLVYKPAPHIYHTYPCEEDLYAFDVAGARLISRELCSVIVPAQAARFADSRGARVERARSKGVNVERSGEYEAFLALEEELLRTKYGVSPAHSGPEMALLAERFPDHIMLFEARRGGTLLAGTIVYETERVAHTQYIATTEEGRRLGALDVICDELIARRFASKPYLSLGVSTTDNGFNPGLVHNKESFGARGIVHDHYELTIG